MRRGKNVHREEMGSSLNPVTINPLMVDIPPLGTRASWQSKVFRPSGRPKVCVWISKGWKSWQKKLNECFSYILDSIIPFYMIFFTNFFLSSSFTFLHMPKTGCILFLRLCCKTQCKFIWNCCWSRLIK